MNTLETCVHHLGKSNVVCNKEQRFVASLLLIYKEPYVLWMGLTHVWLLYNDNKQSISLRLSWNNNIIQYKNTLLDIYYCKNHCVSILFPGIKLARNIFHIMRKMLKKILQCRKTLFLLFYSHCKGSISLQTLVSASLIFLSSILIQANEIS